MLEVCPERKRCEWRYAAMRKMVVCVLLCFVLIVPSAMCEYDLHDMSFDELATLRESLNIEIWTSHNWRDVVVCPGYYMIGQDIPAGEYTIKGIPLNDYVYISFYDGSEGDVGCHAKYNGEPDIELSYGDREKYVFNDGDYIEIFYGSVSFSSDGYVPGFKEFSDSVQNYNFEQYKSLYDDILIEMKSRDEWQEVPIYDGTWEVGTQIPAGRWSIFPQDGELCGVHYGHRLNDDGTLSSSIYNEAIKSPLRSTYRDGIDVPFASMVAKEGYYFEFDNAGNYVVFTPYVGKPLFSFND